jgi:hypothetical protein
LKTFKPGALFWGLRAQPFKTFKAFITLKKVKEFNDGLKILKFMLKFYCNYK